MGRIKAMLMQIEDQYYEDLALIVANIDDLDVRFSLAMNIMPEELHGYIDMVDLKMVLAELPLRKDLGSSTIH